MRVEQGGVLLLHSTALFLREEREITPLVQPAGDVERFAGACTNSLRQRDGRMSSLNTGITAI